MESPRSAEAESKFLSGGRWERVGPAGLLVAFAASSSVSGCEPFSGVGTHVQHCPRIPELCDHHVNSLVQDAFSHHRSPVL